jgi:hypothetical protein
MEKRKTFLIFAIAMIAIMIAFTACSADRGITNRPTLTPDPIITIPIDIMPGIELEQDYRTPRKIPICVKQGKKELCPLGIVDDVMYLGINDDNELMFASTIMAENAECCCVVGLPYIQGQNYYLSATTVFKNVIVEETTEILYYN